MLSVPPAFFFEDMPPAEGRSEAPGFAEEGVGSVVDFLSTAEGLLLNKAFVRIKEARVRKRVIDLVTVLAGQRCPAARPAAGAGQPWSGSGVRPRSFCLPNEMAECA